MASNTKPSGRAGRLHLQRPQKRRDPQGRGKRSDVKKPRRDADPQAGPRMPPPGSFVCVPSGGRRHLRVSAGEQDEGVAARGRPDAPQGPMLPLPEVPVMRDHGGDEQRCSAVVPARCLANRPNGHSGAGGAGSVDAGRALCLAGAAVNSGASGGGRRSEGESFATDCSKLRLPPRDARSRAGAAPRVRAPPRSPACLGFTSRLRFHIRCTKTLKNSLCPARAGRSAPTRGSHRPKRFHGA